MALTEDDKMRLASLQAKRDAVEDEIHFRKFWHRKGDYVLRDYSDLELNQILIRARAEIEKIISRSEREDDLRSRN